MDWAPSGVVPSPEALAAGAAASDEPPPVSAGAAAVSPPPLPVLAEAGCEAEPVPTRTTSSTFSVTTTLDSATRETSAPSWAVTSYVVRVTPSTPSVSTLVSPSGRESVSFSTLPWASVVSSVTV